MIHSRNYYSNLAPFYDFLLSSTFALFGFDETKYRAQMIRKIDGCSSDIPVVDIGCGTGRNFELIRTLLGNRKIYGIDTSNRMLAIAQKRILKNNYTNIYLLENDICKWKEIKSVIGDEYMVVSSFTLSVIWSYEKAIDGFLSLCKNAIAFSIMDGYWGAESIKRHIVKLLSILFGIDPSYWSYSTGERIAEFININPTICFQDLLCYI